MEEVDSCPESDPETQEEPEVQSRVFPIIDKTKGLRKMLNDRGKIFNKMINFSGRAGMGISFLLGKDGPVFIPRKYLSKQVLGDAPRELEIKKQEAISKMRKDNKFLSDKATKQKISLSKQDKNISKKMEKVAPSDREKLKEEIKEFNKWKEEKAHLTWAKKEAWQRKKQSEAGENPKYIKSKQPPTAEAMTDPKSEPEPSPTVDPEVTPIPSTAAPEITPNPSTQQAPLDQHIKENIQSSEGYTYGPESVKSSSETTAGFTVFADVCATVEKIKGLKHALTERHFEFEKYLLNTSLADQYQTLLKEGNIPEKYIMKEAPGDSERIKEVKKIAAKQKMQKDIDEMRKQAQIEKDKLRPLDLQIDQKIQKAREKVREDVKEWKRHKEESARKYCEYQCAEVAEGRECKRPRLQ